MNKLQNTIRLVLTFHLQSLLAWKALGKPSYSDRSIGLKQRLLFFYLGKTVPDNSKARLNRFFLLVFLPLSSQHEHDSGT